MSGEVLMERRPAAPASGHLSIHRQQMQKVIFRTGVLCCGSYNVQKGKLPQHQTQTQELYEVRTCCRNSNIYCWQAATIAISIAGKLPQQQYLLLASCRSSNMFCWQATAIAISIAGKRPQQQFVLLASCRNSNIYCWQAAATANMFCWQAAAETFFPTSCTVPYCIIYT